MSSSKPFSWAMEVRDVILTQDKGENIELHNNIAKSIVISEDLRTKL